MVGESLIIPEHEFGFSMKVKTVRKEIAYIEMKEDFYSPVDSKDNVHRRDIIKIDKFYSKVKTADSQ